MYKTNYKSSKDVKNVNSAIAKLEERYLYGEQLRKAQENVHYFPPNQIIHSKDSLNFVFIALVFICINFIYL